MKIRINTQKQSFCWNLILVLSLAAFFTGCATLPVTSPEELIQSRAAGMMTAKVQEDWEQVYDYFDSAYRNKTSKNAFLNINREMSFADFSIESIEIAPSGDKADVVVKYDMTIKVFDFKDQMETQLWIKEGRNWFLKVEN